MAANRWIRWDAGYFHNAKARALGKDGRSLHLASSCWAGDELTDGFIPTHMLPMLCAEAEVKPAVAAVLVREGAWHVVDGGWIVHDYLDHNPSKERVAAEREKWKRNKAGQRSMSTGDTMGDSRGDTAESPHTDVTTTRRDSDYISEKTDDLLLGPLPSSSFSAEQHVAHQLARHQATARPPDHLDRWLPATRKGILTERAEDIRLALASARGDPERAVGLLLAHQQTMAAAVHEAWYSDPACDDCGGSGLISDETNTCSPCPCRRNTSYLATIHHLPGATA